VQLVLTSGDLSVDEVLKRGDVLAQCDLYVESGSGALDEYAGQGGAAADLEIRDLGAVGAAVFEGRGRQGYGGQGKD